MPQYRRRPDKRRELITCVSAIRTWITDPNQSETIPGRLGNGDTTTIQYDCNGYSVFVASERLAVTCHVYFLNPFTRYNRLTNRMHNRCTSICIV